MKAIHIDPFFTQSNKSDKVQADIKLRSCVSELNTLYIYKGLKPLLPLISSFSLSAKCIEMFILLKSITYMVRSITDLKKKKKKEENMISLYVVAASLGCGASSCAAGGGSSL